jgi:hypothetical protein
MILIAACARVAPGNMKPVGLTCGVSQVASAMSADSVFSHARRAFAAMHVVPLTDSVRRQLLVSGADAPHGEGTSRMQDARMYLDFTVAATPDDSTASTYSVAQGLSIEPSGLSIDDRWKLYRQADEFAAKFMARAGLPWGSCFGKKRAG